MPASEPTAPSPPAAADLLAIPPDDWAWLLVRVRRGLHALDDAALDPTAQRLRASPASRLAGGRMRQALAGVLATDGPVWRSVHAVLVEDPPPARLGWLVTGDRPVRARRRPAAAATAPRGDDQPGRADELRRAKERARSLRAELDELRRQLGGAEARAERLEERVVAQGEELSRERELVRELRDEVAQLRDEQPRLVERERRRSERRIAELEAELQDVRRRDETRREARAREERARELAAQRAREEAATTERRRRQPQARVRPGRPTVLPRSIAPGTREEAEALLGPGRLVLVDGYNVTLSRKPQLSLEEQREWLIRVLAGLASRRRVRPQVVFDGRGDGGGGRPGDAARGVSVVFSPSGVTADDEIALAVEATDEPVVVVTDDRGLRDRVRPHGADLLRADQFLGAAG
ncbi:MAG: NYN domain-containing protein [Actinobacteria bacterium]|nr:NYN domain-containing protein [Actinomycetota bacterium]